jgi:hypothetical protein
MEKIYPKTTLILTNKDIRHNQNFEDISLYSFNDKLIKRSKYYDKTIYIHSKGNVKVISDNTICA